MGWGHFGTIVGDWAARELAREHWGLQTEAPARPDTHRTEIEERGAR